MDNQDVLHVDGSRMMAELEKQGTIGWKKGTGLCREGYSEAYQEVQKYTASLMEKAGLEVRVDSVGNLFGLWKGTESQKGTILTGSHLDSVYGGGIYDGQYGVFGAIEAIRSLKEQGYVPKHNMEVVGFTSEEGGPLGGTFGSRCFCGLADPEQMDKEVLKFLGLTKKKIQQAKAKVKDYSCFLEMHIEQGPVLDRDPVYKLGIPTGIVGILRYRCRIFGEANHAGTTPMKERNDAIRKTVTVLDKWISKVADTGDIVCNVAEIFNKPDQIGVVSGRCEFLVEIRSQDRMREEEAAKWLEELLKDSTDTYEMEKVIDKQPVQLSKQLIKYIEKAADTLSVASRRLPSGASHDAASLGKVLPTAMIFVPSKNGISHNKEEYTNMEELIQGADVLCNTLRFLDEEL